MSKFVNPLQVLCQHIDEKKMKTGILGSMKRSEKNFLKQAQKAQKIMYADLGPRTNKWENLVLIKRRQIHFHNLN